jgi:hypothetical protein
MFPDRILKLAQGLWIYAVSLSAVLKLASIVQVSEMLLKPSATLPSPERYNIVGIWAGLLVASEFWQHEDIQRLISFRYRFDQFETFPDTLLEGRPLFLG